MIAKAGNFTGIGDKLDAVANKIISCPSVKYTLRCALILSEIEFI